MPNESELARRLARLRFLGMTPAKTGHPDGRLNAGTNQTWVQTDNERAPTAVYGTVGARNVPVWLREMPDGSRVLDKPDFIVGGVTYGAALETVSQPQIVAIDKGNAVVIPSQNLDAGRVIPSPDGSLYVRVTPFHYPGGYWDGLENILVTPPAGTLNHHIALVGIDCQTAAGTAVGTVTYGHTYPRTIPLTQAEAARMAIGTMNASWRGWLDLTGGQGSVMGSLVYDARWFSPGLFHGTDGTLTGYSGLVPPSQAADVSKFLRGDGTWASATGGPSSPLTTRGDLYAYTTADDRLPIGTDYQFPGHVDGNVAWMYPLTPASFIDPTITEGDLLYRRVDTVTALGVLFIGDSITDGYGIPTDTATALSVNGLTVTSYNEGVSGTSTDDWSIGSTNDDAAYATFTGNDIRIVSIALGVNDARVAVANDADTYQANLQAIANGWVERGAIVFLHFPTYCIPGSNGGDQDATANSLRVEYQARILQIVNGTTIRLGDATGYTMFANDTSLLTDGIHPTATGADKLAAAWARGMQPGVSQITQVTTLQRLTVGDGLAITGTSPAILATTATPSPGSDPATHVHGLARWAADGSTTAYDLPDIAEYLEMVFDDGAAVDQLTVTLSSDGTQITFDSAPTAGNVLQAQYVILSI